MARSKEWHLEQNRLQNLDLHKAFQTMANHPNRSKTNVPGFTAAEGRLLVRLINIVEATEWDAGDYCLTQQEFDTLQRAKNKLMGE